MKLTIAILVMASAYAQTTRPPKSASAVAPVSKAELVADAKVRESHKVANCFKVLSMKRGSFTGPIRGGIDGPNFEFIAENTCPFFIPVAWVTVKYFDANGYRRGMSLIGAASVSPGEKIRHSFVLPQWIPDDYSRIEVALITTDMKEACGFAPQSCVEGIQSKTPLDAFIPYLKIK